MILQALYEYYNRKLEQEKIAPDGLIEKEIDFVIVLDNSGKFIDIDNLQNIDGKRVFGTPYYVPDIGKQSEKHSNAGDDANLLWDKAEFVFGLGKKGEKKLQSFVETIERFYPSPPKDVAAVLKFYKSELKKDRPFQKILQHKELGETISTGAPIVTFRIQGEKIPIACKPHAAKAAATVLSEGEIKGVCLITGERNVPIEFTHKVTKGVVGSQTSGANLISFNARAFESYGKKQSLNSPVSKRAASRYTKALQHLVDSEINKVKIADMTIVFWAQKRARAYDLESNFRFFVQFSQQAEDQPDKNVEVVKKLYEAVETGKLPQEHQNQFFVLALAPNAARLSIRFFKRGTVTDFGYRIKQHFDDLKIDKPDYERENVTLDELLASVSTETKDRDKSNIIYYRGKYYDVTPNLASAVIESILDGTPYPRTLLQQCVRRIRAEAAKKNQNGKPIPNVTRARAAILKATINRFNRIYNKHEKEITMALDKTNTNPGYLLGRLFAVCVQVQLAANDYKELNTTVRDRFYGSFSTSPTTVFPLLEKLYGHHLNKLEKSKGFFEAIKGEIIDKLKPQQIPAHLSLEEQAHFAIGFYHQRQDFITGKKNKQETTQS